MQKLKTKINFKLVFVILIHFLITFITDHNIFDFKALNILNYTACKIITLVVLSFFWNFIFKLLKKDETALKYFKSFLIYFLPILILLVLCWPGNWYPSDVYNFYGLAIHGEFLYYLNYLSSVFYIVSYMLFPIPSGVDILLAILYGITFSYLLKNLMDIYKSKLVYLILIPFFMFHTLFYTFFANRPIMFGVSYLLLISILLIDKMKNNPLTWKKLLTLSLLTGIVGFWRTESMYLPLAIPLFIFLVYKVKVNVKNLVKILGLSLVAFILVAIPQKVNEFKTKTDAPSSRNLPMYVGPLSYMLTLDLKGENLENDLKNINPIINIEAMEKYPSYNDTYCIWLSNCLNEDYTKEEYEKFQKSYFNILKNNIPAFLKTKVLTFVSSSGLTGDMFTNKDLYNKDSTTILDRNDTKPFLDYRLRKITYSILEGRLHDNVNILYRLSNNLIIPLLIIGAIFIYAIIKRNLFYFLLSGMLLGHTCLVFITAPGSYFMYYYNVYMTGLVLGIFFLIDIVYYQKTKQSYVLDLKAKKAKRGKKKK